MQVNPLGSGASQVPQRINQPTGAAGGRTEAAESAGAQTSQASSGAGSTLSISQSESSFSSRVNSLVTTFAPFTSDQDMLKLLLLLIVLELMSKQNGEEGQGGGALLLGGNSRASFESVEFTQNSTSTSYALSEYSRQDQSFSSPSPGSPAVEPGSADTQGRNLDLQA